MKILLLILVLSPLSFAANHYIRLSAAGTNDGSDWTNAFTAIPTSTLVRGDTYYFAGGSYTGGYTFSKAVSGSLVITFKAATIADHGTATGWLSTYAVDGGAGQAIFSNSGGSRVFTLSASYLTIDGNGTNGTVGCQASICGFKFDNVGCIITCWPLVSDAGLGNFTLKYLEFQGIGDKGNTGPFEENMRFVGSGTQGNGCQTCLIQHVYCHNTSSGCLQTQFADSLTVEYSKFYLNFGNQTNNHGAMWAGDGDTNITIRYNVWQDIEGTAVLEEGVNHDDGSAIKVYGNVFVITSGNPNAKSGVDNGIFASTGGISIPNFLFDNNSIINYINAPSTSGDAVYLDALGLSTTGEVKNNVWYQNTGNANYTTPAAVTVDYNTYLSTTTNDVGAHSFTNGSPTNPFNNWPSGDYTLASEVIDAHLNDGLSLSSPYNLDPNGATRGADATWERGAYEFSGALVPAPAPARGMFAEGGIPTLVEDLMRDQRPSSLQRNPAQADFNF